ncbi:hypothetical protein [Lunatimonas salinarum]|uniref:hypothetical protein n=1 Tax=Lunatimonas salinarum TaxID=1774590 RepID=UPI001AE07B73|nr:hypothetical protein [Lunatimonas salinarum]
MKTEYDHSHLSLTALHKEGIRSPKELEEVIEWKYSHCEEDLEILEFPVFRITGLTDKCKGIRVIPTFNEVGKYITLDARIASRDLIFTLFSAK